MAPLDGRFLLHDLKQIAKQAEFIYDEIFHMPPDGFSVSVKTLTNITKAREAMKSALYHLKNREGDNE